MESGGRDRERARLRGWKSGIDGAAEHDRSDGVSARRWLSGHAGSVQTGARDLRPARADRHIRCASLSERCLWSCELPEGSHWLSRWIARYAEHGEEAGL